MVIGNHLAQHRELSLTAIGLAAHILSVPEGTPVDIRSLAERFPEGRDRIAFALRELEAHGYLERVREHTETGRLVTRTYAHHTPASVRLADAVVPVGPVGPAGAARAGADEAAAAPEAGEPSQEDDQPGHEPHTPDRPEPVSEPRDGAPRDGLHEKAVTLLAGLRRTDPRLTLSLRDVNRMAPSVIDWLTRGATPAAVHHTLTADLPVLMKHPAGVIAYRLRELLPPHLPPAPVPAADTGAPTGGTPRPLPFQDCDGCNRVFRAPAPGHCRDCRSGFMTPGEGACAA
ncbi:helix-turn-helix domain-containing protein [Streptomyces sp. NPDC016626]|uniref:helix-turn-helix domain-containing protein n=1 Tax=Streptomyces sp. NPDC016626 TaxID=3364968 RepID=UPI0036FD541E